MSAFSFITKLLNILQNRTYENTIRWSQKGTYFVVVDEVDFAARVLPTEFGLATYDLFHDQVLSMDFEYKIDDVGVKGYRHEV